MPSGSLLEWIWKKNTKKSKRQKDTVEKRVAGRIFTLEKVTCRMQEISMASPLIAAGVSGGCFLPSTVLKMRAGFNIITLTLFDAHKDTRPTSRTALLYMSSRAPRSLLLLSFPLLLLQLGKPPDHLVHQLSCSWTFSFSSLSRLRLLLAPHAPFSYVFSSCYFSLHPCEVIQQGKKNTNSFIHVTL